MQESKSQTLLSTVGALSGPDVGSPSCHGRRGFPFPTLVRPSWTSYILETLSPQLPQPSCFELNFQLQKLTRPLKSPLKSPMSNLNWSHWQFLKSQLKSLIVVEVTDSHWQTSLTINYVNKHGDRHCSQPDVLFSPQWHVPWIDVSLTFIAVLNSWSLSLTLIRNLPYQLHPSCISHT